MRQHVHETTVFPASWSATGRHFATSPRLWLPAPARPVPGGVAVAMRAMGVEVEAVVEVGEVQAPGDGLWIRPVAWRAATADRLFPRMVGELELSRLDESTCQLALVGGYEPPVSVVGTAADRLVGRHVATSVVRDLLDDVAHRLVELTGAVASAPEPVAAPADLARGPGARE